MTITKTGRWSAAAGVALVVVVVAAASLWAADRLGVAWSLDSIARADPPMGHFVPSSGGITDTHTGLEWEQPISAPSYTHANAVSYCAERVGGWRLPNPLELSSIIDETRHTPAIDPVAFPGTPADYFWTADFRFGSDAWLVGFGDGVTDVANVTISTNMYRVRCVR